MRVSLRIAALGLLAQQPGSGYDLLKTLREVDGQRLAGDPEPALRRAQQARRCRADRGVRHRPARPQGVSDHRGRTRRTAPLDANPDRRPAVPQRRTAARVPARRDPARRRPASTWSRWPTTPTRGQAVGGAARLHRLERGDGAFFGRAALEYGLRKGAMEADWARWLVKAIDKRHRELIVASR